MTIGLIIVMIILFFVPQSLFGFVLIIFDDKLPDFIDRTLFRPIVSILAWPICLAVLGLYFIHSNNFDMLLPKAFIIAISVLAVVHTIHMVFLGVGGVWTIILRIDKTTDIITQTISLSFTGIALLILTFSYFIGFFVLRRFF